jgi:hypothetical protein
MKRFLIAALSCGTCLFSAVPAFANSAEIKATGTMPGTCAVGGTEINLAGEAGGFYLRGEGNANVQTTGRSTISLSSLTTDFPQSNNRTNAYVSLEAGPFYLSQDTNNSGPNNARIEAPYSGSPYVNVGIYTDNKQPLAAGSYNVTTTLTCVSDS